jgi:predicted RNase H-like HicB family nuclease
VATSITLEYWTDEGWFVGCLEGVPGVFSQGKTLDELRRNIREAYRLVLAAEARITRWRPAPAPLR